MKKISRYFYVLPMMAFGFALLLSSCEDGKSYADMLTDEEQAVNRFLADQRVSNEIPADTVFEVGPDAPYYRIDEDGNVYMQVLNAGTKTEANMAHKDQLIYFRNMRYNLSYYTPAHYDADGYVPGQLPAGEGNSEDVSFLNSSFRFENTELAESIRWGQGLQMPLYYLPIDCEVNLVIKSQLGRNDEIAYVVPYMYNVRYYKSQI